MSKIIQYALYPDSGPLTRIAILFDGQTVKLFLEGEQESLIIPPGEGIEIVGAISHLNRIPVFEVG